MSEFGFSDTYFPVLNMVNLSIQFEYEKNGPEKRPKSDTFHTMHFDGVLQ